MKPLPLGKLPIGVLSKTFLRLTGSRSTLVETPAKVGLDFASIRVGESYLIVSADPVTGASQGVGRHAVHVSANDVATSGNRPQFIETVVLLPEGATESTAEAIALEIDGACKEVGAAVVGGHTEVSPRLDRPIVAITAFALVKDYVSSEDAQDGDLIMMTKSAGLEGTAVLAMESQEVARKLKPEMLRRARKMLARISVVDEAVTAYRTGSVNAMHDCTEGGVLGAVFEMSMASGLGFRLERKAVPLEPETKAVASAVGIDPLKLIGSGALLLSVRRGKEKLVDRALRRTGGAKVVGAFEGKSRRLLVNSGAEVVVREPPEDELWRVVGRRAV